MQKIHAFIRKVVLAIVDFFYPLFRRFMPLQTYRYAACGGANMLFDIALYSVTYNYFIGKKIVYIGGFAISPYIFAFLVTFCVTFPIGFYLSMFVVFPESYLRKRIQLLRYFVVVMICILLNYLFLKLFVDVWGWYPTPSLMVATPIIVAFSYFSQRHFSFRGNVMTEG